MNEEATRFVLSCRQRGAPAPVLTGVRVDGRLDAVLFELTLRQTYRNPGRHVLEVVYTFPLPSQAVLLGFASELNGTRKEGVVVGRREAEREYETSLDEGDAPVLLERHDHGLYTASLGNLKPGDEMVLETRFAQVLSFEQGRLRLCLPTTVAPRFGDAGAAGLQPQQVPKASLDAEHPLAMTLTVGSALAGARLACPTHPFIASPARDGSMCVELAPGARLDRDVVMIVTPREATPSLLVRADDPFDPAAPIVMMTAFQPPNGAARDSISLDLLVDCSGSMHGDSIDSARAAMRGVVADLTERDRLSVTRFGSTVVHVFGPSEARPQTLRHLSPRIDAIKADLGGTETALALESVYELTAAADDRKSDVLLITDGQIWPVDAMIAAARRSGRRVFAICVGSAPAEGGLRALAEATGGACEFATPGEALEAAARRMLQRMRQPVFTNARVDWGSTPAWSIEPAAGLFGGDAAIALAGFARPPTTSEIRLLADDAQGRCVELARGEADAPCPGDSLCRIAAARRTERAESDDALALALRYQLVSEHTHCILVHERAEADKAVGPAAMHCVAPMLAAGWGGVGSLAGVDPFSPFESVGSLEGFQRMAVEPRHDIFGDILSAASAPPARDAAGPARLAWFQSLAQMVVARLDAGDAVEDVASFVDKFARSSREVERALSEATRLGLTRGQAWLLLAEWINRRAQGSAAVHAAAVLGPLVSAIDPALADRARKAFARRLGSGDLDAWYSSPAEPAQQQRFLGRARI